MPAKGNAKRKAVGSETGTPSKKSKESDVQSVQDRRRSARVQALETSTVKHSDKYADASDSEEDVVEEEDEDEYEGSDLVSDKSDDIESVYESDDDTAETTRRRNNANRSKSTSKVQYSPSSSPSVSGHDNNDQAIINTKTMKFLKDLARNNERDWFHGNKEVYKKALDNFQQFGELLQTRITEIDTTVPELPMKDLLFRIHRDIRFSNDSTPYKTYMALGCSRTGRKGLYGKYYFSLQPGNQTFIGGGLWHPEASHVALLRRDIDRHPNRLKNILKSEVFFRNFLNAETGDVKEEGKGKEKSMPKTAKTSNTDVAIKNFIKRNSEDALKTAPKGYDKDHPDIELLRLKSFTVGKRISDDEMVLPNSIDYLGEIIRAMEPFITYLNSVVMPDLGVPPPTHQHEDEDSEDE